MTNSMLWLFGAGLFVAALYLPLANRSPGVLRSLLKTLPLGLFALASGMLGLSPFLTAALLFSALGDLVLSRTGRQMFLLGLGAFTLAHVFYTIFFLGVSGGPLWGAFVVAPFASIILLFLTFSTQSL